MMKLLFLAPRLPLPADTGGKIRTLNILRQVAKNLNVHLVCFSFDEKDESYSRELKDFGIEVTLVPMKEPGFINKVLSVLFNPIPYSMAKYFSTKMAAAITALIESKRYDAAHVDHLHMAHYQKFLRGLPCVVDEHNVEFKILERCASVESSLVRKVLFKVQAVKMKIYEAGHIQHVAECLAVSSDDKEILRELSQSKTAIQIVPNGVDTEYFRPPDVNSQLSAEDALVFTGSMDWLPNEDSVLYFCNEILPLIWKAKPHVKFYIVGKSSSPKVTDLGKNDARIVVTGRVDDVRTYVARSKIFVVPLRIGGGTRLKILEAMSMQKAVVSTTIGAEGIAYIDGTNIILADSPNQFAKKVVALLDDPQKMLALGAAGRKLACVRYDWNIIGQKLNEIYKEVLRVK